MCLFLFFVFCRVLVGLYRILWGGYRVGVEFLGFGDGLGLGWFALLRFFLCFFSRICLVFRDFLRAW